MCFSLIIIRFTVFVYVFDATPLSHATFSSRAHHFYAHHQSTKLHQFVKKELVETTVLHSLCIARTLTMEASRSCVSTEDSLEELKLLLNHRAPAALWPSCSR